MIVDEPRPLRTRIRWWVAKQLDCRSRRTCWADLVSFALGDSRSPWQPIRPECRRDAAANGYCYCGSVQDPSAAIVAYAARPGAAPAARPDVPPVEDVAPTVVDVTDATVPARGVTDAPAPISVRATTKRRVRSAPAKRGATADGTTRAPGTGLPGGAS